MQNQKKKIKAAVYARYSCENQRETSIEDQIRICKEFAAVNNYDILENCIYFDSAKDGQSTNHRESFLKMYQLALSGNAPFEYILVDSTSRTSRNPYEAINTFAELTFRSIFVYYIAQNIDTASETAVERVMVNSIVDTLHTKNLAHNTRRGIQGRVLNGFSGGGRKYGYVSKPIHNNETSMGRPEGYKLEINEKESETILKIFSLYGEEFCSIGRIAKILNAEHDKTGMHKPPCKSKKSEPRWCKAHIKGILKNEIYIGIYIWGRRTIKRNLKNGQKSFVENPSEKCTTRDMPELRIISKDLWDKVQLRLKEGVLKNKQKPKSAKAFSSDHLLTRTGQCGHCFGTFGIVQGGKYAKYGCTAYFQRKNGCMNPVLIKKNILEEQVVYQLMEAFSDANHAESIVSGIKTALAELFSQLNTVNEEITNISDAIRKGIATETTQAILSDAENRRNEICSKLNIASTIAGSKNPFDIDKVIKPSLLNKFFLEIKNKLADPNSTKEIINEVVDKVTYTYDSASKAISIEVTEKADSSIGYVLNHLQKMDPRIRFNSRTGLLPYTNRIIKFVINI